MRPPPLGAHVSIAGGLERAVERGAALGCDAVQLFVKSPNRWQGPPLDGGAVDRFRAARAASPIGPAIAHAAYLINLAAVDPETLERSRRALADELELCDRLGLDALVVHPGAHMGAGEAAGLERIVESLEPILARRPPGGARLLLETTAGQGTVLGHRIEQLARLRDGCRRAGPVGVCLDTCHLFAAGYGLDRRRGYDRFFRRFDRHFDRHELGAVHLNDSRHPIGSRRDRHANLGAGEIGTALWKRLVAEPRLAGVPLVLETPLGADRQGHRRDLARLRRWAPGG